MEILLQSIILQKKVVCLNLTSDDVTENLIESRNELMNAYEDLFLSELYNPTDE
jgi:hypothetical protein